MYRHENVQELPLGDSVQHWQAAIYPTHTVLKGHYCRIEPLSVEQHAASLYEANALDGEGKMWAYLPYGPFQTFKVYQQWLLDVCRLNDSQFYAIVDINTGYAVGVASYLRINPQMGSIEVGHVCFSPALQATTAATEAMYLMMEKVFKTGYRRYEWKCNALNRASFNAAKRLGFSFEGIFRQTAVIKDHNRDTAWFSIIDKEWLAIKAAFLAWLANENFNSQGMQYYKLSELHMFIANRD